MFSRKPLQALMILFILKILSILSHSRLFCQRTSVFYPLGFALSVLSI